MSAVDPTCEYVLNPSDPGTWNGTTDERCFVDTRSLDDDGLWRCPRAPESDEELCLFHLPVESKDDNEAVDALVRAIEGERNGVPYGSERDEPGPKKWQCFGARFGDLDLSGVELTADSVELSHTSVDGSCDWFGATLNTGYLDLAGLATAGDGDFRGCTFGGYTSFAGATFGGDALFDSARFQNTLDARFSTVEGAVSFSAAEFSADAGFTSTEFRGDADFTGMVVTGGANFTRATFRGDVDFDESTFVGSVDFVSMGVHSDISFEDVTFEGESDFSFTEVGDVDRSGIR